MALVSIPVGDRVLPVYVARPPGAAQRPAVVVLHDIAGMSSDLRAQADWLASEGFLAAAPDLFDGGTLARCLLAIVRDYTAWRGTVFDQIEAVRGWLTDQAQCTGRVGVVGFCVGGDFAVLLAPTGRYGAASVSYGRLPRAVDTALHGTCPVVASYGARDRSLRGAARRLEHALDEAGVAHDVKEYPDAGHAFLNQHPPGEIPALFALLGRVNRAGYHAASAADARTRITSFLHTHLDAPA